MKGCGSSGVPGPAHPGSRELAVPISSQPYIPDVTLLVCNGPRWEHLHHSNQQMLQTRSCATKASGPTTISPPLPGSQELVPRRGASSKVWSMDQQLGWAPPGSLSEMQNPALLRIPEIDSLGVGSSGLPRSYALERDIQA